VRGDRRAGAFGRKEAGRQGSGRRPGTPGGTETDRGRATEEMVDAADRSRGIGEARREKGGGVGRVMRGHVTSQREVTVERFHQAKVGESINFRPISTFWTII